MTAARSAPVLGLIGFLVLGLLLLLCAATPAARGGIGAVGVISLVAGVLGAAVSAEIRADVGFGTDTAWFAAIAGAVLLLASMFGSTRVAQRREHVERV